MIKKIRPSIMTSLATNVMPCFRTKTKIRCRGMPLAFYSLVFWLLLWFVFGVVVWQGNWVNVGDVLNYDETKKKILSLFSVEDNI